MCGLCAACAQQTRVPLRACPGWIPCCARAASVDGATWLHGGRRAALASSRAEPVPVKATETGP